MLTPKRLFSSSMLFAPFRAELLIMRRLFMEKTSTKRHYFYRCMFGNVSQMTSLDQVMSNVSKSSSRL